MSRNQPYRIVVVDRSHSVRRAVQLAFPSPLFQVQAFTRRQDFEDSGTLIPDAILIGLSLPNTSGYSLARDLKDRSEFNRVPLFLLREAFARMDDRALDETDYEEIIREPFDSASLRSRVRQSIDARRDPESLPEEPDLSEDPAPSRLLEERLTALIRAEVRGLEERLERKLEDRIRGERERVNPDGTDEPQS